MSADAGAELVEGGCGNLRQGDVVGLRRLLLVGASGDPETMETPEGVAILSQTCDVVQSGRTRCLVAPVIPSPSRGDLSSAQKGRKPLHLYLESSKAEPAQCLADMEHAVSVPKEALVGLPIVVRYVEEASSSAARQAAWRVGRAFNRFPFPDEVYPALRKLREQAQGKAGSDGNLGQVLDLVEDLRVAADQWSLPGRKLKLYIVVREELLIAPDDIDPSWIWDKERVKGLRVGEQEAGISLDRVSALIIANLEGDKSSLAHLWSLFGEVVHMKLLLPSLSEEVVSFDVEVLSDSEMTYRIFQSTESLDLEVLSDSTDASD